MKRVADSVAAARCRRHSPRLRHAGRRGRDADRALEAAGIRFVLARHETAAAIMAAGALP